MSGSVRFTEVMAGYVWPGAPDWVGGWARGRTERSQLAFRLTIAIDDIGAFLRDPRQTATAVGWVEGDAVGGRWPVDRGDFNLFVAAGEPRMRTMLYRLPFRDGQGRAMVLEGHKEVGDDPGFDLWRDTTRLATTVRADGPEGSARGDVLARGILAISPRAFLAQVLTFRGSPMAIARFGVRFATTLCDVYLARSRRRRLAA
jgi:cholesterol oxidase